MNNHNQTSQGVLMALAGFALLSCGDAVVKTMSADWSPLGVAALRFSIGAIGLSVLLLMKEGAAGFVPQSLPLQIGRGACLAVASLCFFWAIFLMPLADAMAIAFMAPIFVALLSRPLLAEKVPPAIWLVCLISFAGVGLILRPKVGAFGWAAFLPLLSSIFFALMVILNRASAGQGSVLSMQAFIAIFATPFLIAAAWLGHSFGGPGLHMDWPSWDVAARCAFVAVSATSAHWLIFMGTERAGAASIAPTTYVQMLVAITLGYAVFGDVPDWLTLAGAASIIIGGVILWRSSRRGPRARP
jgi:drug/metabolite transporter (DMT)-like permease